MTPNTGLSVHEALSDCTGHTLMKLAERSPWGGPLSTTA